MTKAGSLWRHRDFLTLWAGETVSVFGTQVTSLALPLTAVVSLHASPSAMAALTTVRSLPVLLFGVLAGVWADRVRRRPLLVWTNLARAVLLGTIPVAALLGALTLGQLFGVAFLAATMGVVFAAAYASIPPSLVEPEQLVDANSKLQISNYLARITGPGLTGILVQVLTAPVTIAIDAVSYIVSAAALLSLGTPEVPPASTEHSMVEDLREGVTFVARQPVVRAMMLAVGTANLFLGALVAEYVLYLNRDLGLAPGVIGLVLSMVGPSGLAGTLIAPRVASRLGPGRAMIAGGALYGVGVLFYPLASGSQMEVLITLGVWDRSLWG